MVRLCNIDHLQNLDYQYPNINNRINLQKFKQSYQLLLDGSSQNSSRYHSIQLNQPSFRIHSNSNPHDGIGSLKKRLPELRLRDAKRIDLTYQLDQHQKVEVQQPKLSKIDTKVRRVLSNHCKNNFLQFLNVQKAGQVGDYKMFQQIIDSYRQVDAASARPKLDKKSVLYLKMDEENAHEITEQVQQVLRHKNQVDLRRQTPLDDFIRNVHESKSLNSRSFQLPKIHDKTISVMNKYDI